MILKNRACSFMASVLMRRFWISQIIWVTFTFLGSQTDSVLQHSPASLVMTVQLILQQQPVVVMNNCWLSPLFHCLFYMESLASSNPDIWDRRKFSNQANASVFSSQTHNELSLTNDSNQLWIIMHSWNWAKDKIDPLETKSHCQGASK